MKILQVNCVYKIGSTGKIVYDLHNCLKGNGIESVVCYGRGKVQSEKNVYKTSSEIMAKFNNLKSRITGIPYGGCYVSTQNLIHRIKLENPDIVHLHCINGYFVNIYKIINFLKQSKIKTILTLHAEFMYTANCGYSLECNQWKSGCIKCPQLEKSTRSYIFDRTNESWKRMKKSFDGFDDLIVISVSDWLKSRAKESSILKDKNHYTILNGIDNEKIFYPRKFEYLKERHNLTDEKILLHVTADFSNEIKGGKFIIALANQLKQDNIKIIIVGNRHKGLNLPDNIIDVGRCENQDELAAYYSMADLTILTSKKETFSMICAESLSCGTPIIGFKAGAPEQISLKNYSKFVDYGDLDKLKKAIYNWIDRKDDLIMDNMIKECKVYSKKEQFKEYMKYYKELIKK